MTMTIPSYSLDITALTETRDDNPTSAVQYCVVDTFGGRHVYGDQNWVASGQAVIDAHFDGHIEQRTISISYGEWSSIPSESRSNP
jgi:hypothetical protein